MLSLDRPLTSEQCHVAVEQLYQRTVQSDTAMETLPPTSHTFHMEWHTDNQQQVAQINTATIKSHSKKYSRPRTVPVRSLVAPVRTTASYVDPQLQHAHLLSTATKPHNFLPRVLDVPSKADSLACNASYDPYRLDQHRHIPTVNLLPNSKDVARRYGKDDDKGPGYYYNTVTAKYAHHLPSEKHSRVDFSRTTFRDHCIIGRRQNNDKIPDTHYALPVPTIKGGYFATTPRVHSAPARQRTNEIYGTVAPCKDTRNRHKFSMTPRFSYADKTEHIKALAGTYRRTVQACQPSTWHVASSPYKPAPSDAVIDTDCHTFVTNMQHEQAAVADEHDSIDENQENTVPVKHRQLDGATAAVDYELYHRHQRQLHVKQMDRIVNRDKYVDFERQRKRTIAAKKQAEQQLLILVTACSRLQYCNAQLQQQRTAQAIQAQRIRAATTVQCWYRYLRHKQLKRKQAVAIHVIVRVLRYNIIKQKLRRKRFLASAMFAHLYDVAVWLNTVKLIRRLKQHAATIQRWYRSHLAIKRARITALAHRWQYVESLIRKQYIATTGNALLYEARKKSALPKKMTAAQQRQHYMNQVQFEHVSEADRHRQLMFQYNQKAAAHHKQVVTHHRDARAKQRLQLLESQAAEVALQAGTAVVVSPSSTARTLQPDTIAVLPFVWVLSVSQTCQQLAVCWSQTSLSTEQVAGYKAAMAQVLMQRTKLK